MCSSDPVSALIEELQFTLGEGPCIDAFSGQRPVLESELAAAPTRWPAFSPRAVDMGVHAIFGFPMVIGAARIGALNLYRAEPGPLRAEQHADALVLAGVAARAVLAAQAGAPPGALGPELEASSDFRVVVHQAAGMVSVQLDVSVAEALVRLRAYAYANDHSLNAVAQDVVARRLRFT